jgi:hypothetical protein
MTSGGISYLIQSEAVITEGERVWRTGVKRSKMGPRSRKAPDRKDPIDGSDLTRREAADYIATLVDELKSIAQADRLSARHGKRRGASRARAGRLRAVPDQ